MLAKTVVHPPKPLGSSYYRLIPKQLTLLAASLSVASPIEAREASPIAAAAPATSSVVAKGTIEYISYFASPNCEFTSVTAKIAANTCVDVGDVGESFAFDGFSGKASCKLEVFSKPGCKGSVVKKSKGGSIGVARTCSTMTAESAKLVC
ncbi:hypothetical protein LTR53_017865 [Teratosphaeriaceae sp. CCFEE 6253]|nr:hypothetical protein LTR53_017865 [Teratosphaeriaceae sp. CCFEE 6253]